VLLKEQ